MSTNWVTYYENTKGLPPAPLLVQAMEHVHVKKSAIDIGGGGTLKDTKYLLSQGFETTIIDREEAVGVAVQHIQSSTLKFFLTDFADFVFPQNAYDLAAAIYSLPFTQPHAFARVFTDIQTSLVDDGIFCGQFFGNRDGWHLNPNLTFVTREAAQSMLSGMRVILFNEREFDGKTADGKPKHWHVFDIIARKLGTGASRD